MILTQIFPTGYKPPLGMEIEWPDKGTLRCVEVGSWWSFVKLHGTQPPFDGGDLWEEEDDLNHDRPLPWVL
jgi:hypothetical protein